VAACCFLRQPAHITAGTKDFAFRFQQNHAQIGSGGKFVKICSS
jgi:hypothetical protein